MKTQGIVAHPFHVERALVFTAARF